MNRSSKRGIRFVAAISTLGLFFAACGSDDGDADPPVEDQPSSQPTGVPATNASTGTAAAPEVTDESTAPVPTDETATSAEPLPSEDLEEEVVLFSNHTPESLEALEAAFEEAYPEVDMTFVRQSDADMQARVDADMGTGSPVADIVVQSDRLWFNSKASEGWWVPPLQIAAVDEGVVQRDDIVQSGDFSEIGAAIITFAWNSDLVPEGLNDWPDLLRPEFANGEIAVLEPSVSLWVDYYRWMEETYGTEFIESLGAQRPRIYSGGGLPLQEGLAAGEVGITTLAAPPVIDNLKASGAPVEIKIGPEGAWGVPYLMGIFADAPHPAAAQALATFMLSVEGQEILADGLASVLPDVSSALAQTSDLSLADLEQYTPESVAEYQARWDSIFR